MVAITPAAGFVDASPRGCNAALGIGLVTGPRSGAFAVKVVKPRLGYDDSLDAFGVHGVGGVIGILATGVSAYGPLSKGLVTGGLHQLGVQAVAMAGTLKTTWK